MTDSQPVFFRYQVTNGRHPNHPEATFTYQCNICGENGSCFGPPTHFQIRRLEENPDYIRPFDSSIMESCANEARCANQPTWLRSVRVK